MVITDNVDEGVLMVNKKECWYQKKLYQYSFTKQCCQNNFAAPLKSKNIKDKHCMYH